jgi:hypothetical protein
VVGETDRTGRRQELPEDPLTLHQRQGPSVPIAERQEIEDEQDGRQLEGRPIDIGAPGQAPALLQSAEAGTALLIEDDDFTVQKDPIVRKPC